ncbi:MAG: TonB-dependent receptor [Acidobacteriota bacterium]
MKSVVSVWGTVCLMAVCLFSQDVATVRLRGRVIAGEARLPLAGVEIRIAGIDRRAVADEKGEFVFTDLAAGEIELIVGQTRQVITLGNADNFVEIVLQRAAIVTDSVTIRANGASLNQTDAPVERMLTERETNLLSSATIADPLRAAQAMAGVSGNDDLSSRFALRGAGMRRVGFYIDGVLTGAPLHAISEDQGGGSVSALNAETIGSLSLLASAYPVRFGDSTAGALLFETRAGDRQQMHFRLASGLISTSAVAEGPLPGGRGSWLVAARRSYLGYVIRRLQKPGLVFDFTDLQTKVVYDANERQQFSVTAILGQTAAQREKARAQLSLADPLEINAQNRLVIGQWSFTPSSRAHWQNRFFALQDDYSNTNPAGLQIDAGSRAQFGWSSDWQFKPHEAHLIQTGISLRWMRGANRSGVQLSPTQLSLTPLVDYRKQSLEQGYYAQDTWRLWGNRLALTGGMRVDSFNATEETVITPRLLLSVNLSESAQLRFGWSRHAQFPGFDELFGLGGNARLRAERATHRSLAFEQKIGATGRLTVEFFDRQEQGLFFGLDQELVRAGLPPTGQLPLGNSLQGYARGLEVSLEHRNGKRFNGWINYSFLRTRLRDRMSGQSFASDDDQRHTISAYGNFRFAESWQVSGLWKFGSGLPVVGFRPATLNGQPSFTDRNLPRLPIYSRFDLRLDKSFQLHHLKFTFTAEFLNLFGRRNLRQVRNGFETVLPFVPSGGLKIEW